MSVSKLLNTDGTYTQRNGYFGSYTRFLDSCYDYDDNSTYVMAEKPDGSVTLIRTQDDGGTFEDLGLVGVTPAVVSPIRGETTLVAGWYLPNTLVAGDGIISFCTHFSATASNQFSHNLSDSFTNAWTKTTTGQGVIARTRMGGLYLELNHSGIYTAPTAGYAALTQRHAQSSSHGFGGNITICPNGTARAGTGASVISSANGVDWVRTTLSVPTGFTVTTDKRPHVGAAFADDYILDAFHSRIASYNGMLLGTDVGASAQRRDAIGEVGVTTSPTNIALSVSYDIPSDTFFATTQHKITGALSYWSYTVGVNGLPDPQDWAIVNTAGAPSGSADSPTASVTMTVIA